MKIGSILENQKNEKRISITPDVIKKYISLGCEIVLSKNYGLHLGINDKEYSDEGAKLILVDINSNLLKKVSNHYSKITLLLTFQRILILNPY